MTVLDHLRRRRWVFFIAVILFLLALNWLSSAVSASALGKVLVLLLALLGGLSFLIASMLLFRCPFCGSSVNGVKLSNGYRILTPTFLKECPTCKKSLEEKL